MRKVKLNKAKRQSVSEFDDSDLFSDQEFNLPGFIDSMEGQNERHLSQGSVSRLHRQRIDDRKEAKWLRGQIQDWDDWED